MVSHLGHVLRITLLLLAGDHEACAQGTIIFYNRHLTDPATGETYHAPIRGPEGISTQLYRIENGIYTPLPGISGTSGVMTFRPRPNNHWMIGPLTVEVPGAPWGTSGVQVVVRAWLGPNYESSDVRAESEIITLGWLGGVDDTGAPISPPNLGGAIPGQGFRGLIFMPEPSTYALFALGAAVLAFRRKK